MCKKIKDILKLRKLVRKVNANDNLYIKFFKIADDDKFSMFSGMVVRMI